MGYVYTDITLKNAQDVLSHMSGTMQEPDIRQTTVQAMVDTGAGTLIMNDGLRQELGLRVMGEKYATLANRAVKMCKYTEPVQVNWGNRSSMISAVIIEGADEVLLGAIPLEEMDLVVDPARQTLIGAHGDIPLMRI
ncbi:MAG: retroviral-like aspartic protease family protein [Treponema sp.]|jgi:clan AA aspartic protease|nr:retroviral-like aspartic protease family protein [Treponema sp.]